MLWPSCWRVAARRSTQARSSGPNHGGDPAAAFSAIRLGWAVAVRETCTRGSLGPHLIRAWLQVVMPRGHSGASWAGLGGGARAALAERAREQDAEAEVAGQLARNPAPPQGRAW